MKQLLIGLWGPAGVGKDSIADALGFPKASFAAQLKSDLAPILDGLGIDITDRQQKERVRGLLVELGKTARSINPNHWVKRLALPEAPVVTVCDVRYWNEIVSILVRGGVVYEIIREGFAPANKEEEASFDAIRSNISDLGVSIPVIHNTTPESAAQDIQWDLRVRTNRIRVAVPDDMFWGDLPASVS